MHISAFLAVSLWALFGGEPVALAAPIKMEMSTQTLGLKVRREKGSQLLLSQPLSLKVTSKELEWEYITGTSISVPFISLQLQNIPEGRNLSVLIARSQKLVRNKEGNYELRIPIMRKDNVLPITIIDSRGAYEDWEIMVSITLEETAIYVDETCSPYALKIKELKRADEANLIYLGCRIGTTVKDVSLDILWPDMDEIEYQGKSYSPQSTVVTFPLDNKIALDSQFVGVRSTREKSIYNLQFVPYSLPPFEFWAGLAGMRSNFFQSNFLPAYTGYSLAFMGQFWFRPEDIGLSVSARGFGTIYTFVNELDPNPGFDEYVATYFANLDLRYKVLDLKGWRLDPMLGGWFYFMNVESRQFGLQRVINPAIGFTLNRKLFKRDYFDLGLRFVPLQNFVNPFAFRADQAYYEVELSYVYPFALRHRIHASIIFGYLDYNPREEDFARTRGNYLVIGIGYGL